MNYSTAVASRNGKHAPQPLTITVIDGGAYLAYTRHPAMWPPGVVVVCDVPNEIERVLLAPVPPNLLIYPLAVGQTASTLANHAEPDVQQAISNVAAMNAASGLGQWRGMGALAIDNLLGSPDMKRLLEGDLLDALLQMNGGILDHVCVGGKGGLSGGTSSASLPKAVQAIANAITSRCDATVEVRLECVGALSYVGLGPRVQRNGSAGMVDAVAYTTAKDHHEREVRSLTLMELPPVGRDRDARDRLMLEVEQAKQCAQVTEVLDQTAPNRSLAGPLGNVTVWQADHYHHLHPQFDIAPDVVASYVRTLREISSESRPQPSLVEKLTFTEARADLPREDLEHIADRVQASDLQELVETIAQPGSKVTVGVIAVLQSGESLMLGEAATVWASPPTSVGETRKRLVIQRSVLSVLDAEIGSIEARLADLTHQRFVLEQHLRRATAALQPQGILIRLRSALSSPARRLERFRLAAGYLRQTVDAMQQASGELHGVRHARRQVFQQTRQFELRLAEISSRLEGMVPLSERGRTEPLVTPRHIDDVFAALWQIRNDADEGQLCRTLVASVNRVTLAGLAKITAAQPPRLEVIASQITSGSAVDIAGPPWGGKRRVMDGLKFYVIPPVAPEMGEKLRQLIHDRDPGCVVVAIADAMPASINGLTLRIHNVNDIGEDLLTQGSGAV